MLLSKLSDFECPECGGSYEYLGRGLARCRLCGIGVEVIGPVEVLVASNEN